MNLSPLVTKPISLITSFSKIFEKLIYNILFTHTFKNDILVDEQYGFIPNISTEIASYKIIKKKKNCSCNE